MTFPPKVIVFLYFVFADLTVESAAADGAELVELLPEEVGITRARRHRAGYFPQGECLFFVIQSVILLKVSVVVTFFTKRVHARVYELLVHR